MTPRADRAYFAAFLDVRGQPAVVVGGGEVAEGKAEALLRSGARVTVVAPVVRPRLADWASVGVIVHRARRFEPRDLTGAAIAVAATDDACVNAAVAAAAKSLHIPVNVADAPALSSFIMPSVVDRGPVQIAVTTGGASPVLARRLAALVASAVPTAFGSLALLAAEFRERAKARFAGGEARRQFWERVIDGPVAREVLEGREAQARRLIERELASEPTPPPKEGMAHNP